MGGRNYVRQLFVVCECYTRLVRVISAYIRLAACIMYCAPHHLFIYN